MTPPQSQRAFTAHRAIRAGFTASLGVLLFSLTPLAAQQSIATANVDPPVAPADDAGPVLVSSEIARGAMLLHFTNAETGLLLQSPGRGAFKIAGSDHVWFPAEAHLVNGVVVVSTSLVQEPAAAHYDWSRSAEAALFNSAGLPAKPFRTDK